MTFNLADIIFELKDKNCFIPRCATEYSVKAPNPDVTLNVSESDIANEKKYNDEDVNIKTLGINATYRKISTELLQYNAFVLHSAVIDVNGVGVAFTALSGTGKTTHMMLWQQLLCERMTIVNGDKPIIRFFDVEPNQPYAYGTPWNGREKLGCNMRTPLKHICFIERNEQNSCESISTADAINLIFNQVYMPKSPTEIIKTINLIDRFISSCSLWKIKCNMDISAAKTAYNTIFGFGN